MLRTSAALIAFLSLTACGTPDGGSYPDLSDAPPAPETTLTPERTAQITQELEEARNEATSYAAQGRREGNAVPTQEPEPTEETSDEATTE